MSKPLSLDGLQDQPGRCGPAATPRTSPSGGHPLEGAYGRGAADDSVGCRIRGLSSESGRHGYQRVTIDTRAGACGCVMV